MMRAVKKDVVLAKGCRRDAMLTAGRVVNFIKRLTNENTRAFWYPCTPHPSNTNKDSRVNFSIVGTFLLALLFTSRDPTESTELHKSIESYRWKLRLHSRGESNLTDLALFRLDSLLTSAADTNPSPADEQQSDVIMNGTTSPLQERTDATIATGFVHESPRADFEALGSASDSFSIHDLNLNTGTMGSTRVGGDLDFEYWMNNSLFFGNGESDKMAGSELMTVLPDFFQIEEGQI